jgi:hypothetical protein
MNGRYIPILVVALALGACERGSQSDILVGTTGTVTPTFAVAECVARDGEGRCVKATCRADEESDCTRFAAICLEFDFHYAGTAASGECSLIL